MSSLNELDDITEDSGRRRLTAEAARQRIHELRHLNAFITVTSESGSGRIVAVKDLIDVRGTPTTGGGVIFPRRPVTDDAPVITRLRSVGCVIIGKTNLHEWAFGVTSINPHFGAVRNPHDAARMAGGSSGGSAVAVAAGMSDWAIGTDTGGSIRIPASLCGVVGFKPTIGTIEAAGVIPLAPSLDTLGPIAPTVGDAARALEAMGGRQLTVSARPPNAFRLAVPRGWVDDLDPETESTWRWASEGLPEIPFPERATVAEPAFTIAHAEAARYHEAWLDLDPSPYGADVLENLRFGLSIDGTRYRDAIQQCRRLREEVESAMADWDAILLPTTARVAPDVGATDVREPLARFTRPFNTTGQPVVTIPAPTDGLPVGIQIIGHFGKDAHLMQVARALERAWAVQQSTSQSPPSSRHVTSRDCTHR